MFSHSDFLTRKDVINVPGQLDGVDPREGLQDAGGSWSTEQLVEDLEVSAPQRMVKDKMIQRQRRVTESMDQLRTWMNMTIAMYGPCEITGGPSCRDQATTGLAPLQGDVKVSNAGRRSLS